MGSSKMRRRRRRRKKKKMTSLVCKCRNTPVAPGARSKIKTSS